MPTVQIRSRISVALKRKNAAVLKNIGLDETSYISMALTQLVDRRGRTLEVNNLESPKFDRQLFRDLGK